MRPKIVNGQVLCHCGQVSGGKGFGWMCGCGAHWKWGWQEGEEPVLLEQFESHDEGMRITMERSGQAAHDKMVADAIRSFRHTPDGPSERSCPSCSQDQSTTEE